MRFLSFKLDEQKQDGFVSGYASVFGNKDSYGDVVEHGAFDSTLKNQRISQIKMLWQHDTRQPIGKWEKAEVDQMGLRLSGRLLINSHVPKADEAHTLVKEGVVDGLSIGYLIVKDKWDDHNKVMRLQEIDLKETSLVTFPANNLSRVTEIKSVEDLANYKRRVEGILREAGFSRKEALDIVTNGVKADFMKQSESAQSAELIDLAKFFRETVEKIKNTK